MDDLRGANALVTGAAGGIGRHIARALAASGVNVALSGRHPETLADLRRELCVRGAAAESVVADLADLSQAAGLVERAEAAIGPLDLLISNAAVEVAAAYPAFTDDELERVVRVNLVAPMILARHALAGMLERGRGHLVAVASIAGKGGNAYNVAYATTKAGLVGFTRSLRAELGSRPVGASVVCPGFVARDGMYPRMQALGLRAPLALRPVAPERVATAVLRAIRTDLPELLVTAWPMRPLFALQELTPRLMDRIVVATGAPEFFARLAEKRGRNAPASSQPPAP